MTLSIIAAMSSNRVIGRDNALPWHLKADLVRFKQLTMGSPLIMGRRTFESIGRPLPGRTMVVISRRADFAPAGVRVAHSIGQALDIARQAAPGGEAFIAGGADIYRQTLELADRVYLTILEGLFEGDTFFPEMELSHWRVTGDERHAGEAGLPPFRFLVYDRKEGH
jgi:dihydrofolate reductase